MTAPPNNPSEAFESSRTSSSSRILLPALVGEASLCLWLLARGVNVSKWQARASAKPAPSALSGALK